MKFYLLKNVRGTFSAVLGYICVAVNNERQTARIFIGDVLMDITPIDQSSSEIRKCVLLKALLDKEVSAADGGANPLLRDRDSLGTLFIRLAVSDVNHRDGRLILRRDNVGDALSKLANLFKGIAVQLELSLLENEQEDARVLATIQSKDKTLLKENGKNSSVQYPVEYFIRRMDARDSTVSARVTMTVTIPDDIFEARCGPTTVPIPQKMLEDEVLSDVTIVCGDGKGVQAHRSFLASRSPVFLAMFQTDMKEARESTVEISDMEEKSVRAFLKYLYYDDTKDAEEDFKVALELFKAGHKYDVKCLERKMKDLLLNKPNDKTDMKGALKLFLFARNLIPAEEELMKKAVKVLERYSENLRGSPEMQQLFRTNYEAALDLFQYAFQRN